MDVRTLLIGIVIGLLAGWLIEWFIDWRFWRRGGRKVTPAAAARPAEPAVPDEPVEPDDLTRIEGIGPKLQSILNGAGIKTFESLADTSPVKLATLVEAADFQAPYDPSSWPEQAHLAAKGDWAALAELQDRLVGGRERLEPDDLTQIEGIGPMLRSILNAEGIKTFESLAEHSPAQLTRIVEAADFKAPFDPSSWPEQADLAAKGDWEALEELQERLVGGREETS